MPERDDSTQIVKALFDGPVEDQPDRQWQWARPQVEGLGPSARGGHTATLVGAKIFVFGGHRFGGGEAEYFNDTYVLDVDSNQWTQVRCKGTPPTPRYGHSAALVAARIVFFGGLGENGPLRDLHALDTTAMTWYQGPSSGGAPAARHAHSSSLHGTRLLVFGGAGASHTFGDVHILDLASMAWTEPTTSGPAPTPRMGHAALMANDQLIVHGGFYLPPVARKATSFTIGGVLHDSYLNDVRVLDVNTLVWSRMRTHGAPPSGCFGHSLALSGDDLLVLGGWRGHAKRKDQGTEGSSHYCHLLVTSEMRWQKVRYAGVAASERYGHTVTMVGPHAIVFGGWDGGKPLNDLVVLRDRSQTEE